MQTLIFSFFFFIFLILLGLSLFLIKKWMNRQSEENKKIFVELDRQTKENALKIDSIGNNLSAFRTENKDQSSMIETAISSLQERQDERVSAMSKEINETKQSFVREADIIKWKINCMNIFNSMQISSISKDIITDNTALITRSVPQKTLEESIKFLGEDIEIVFNKIEFPKTEEFKYDISEPLKATIPSAVMSAISFFGARGLYHATVPVTHLIRYANGSISSMIRDGNSIGAHSGFIQAGASGIFVPLIVFQVLSIITGQYYLHGITRQLNKIHSKLDHLIKLHHNEKISILQADFERLLALSQREHLDIEDMVEIRNCIADAYSMHREYSNLLMSINSDELKKSLDKWLTSSRLDELGASYPQIKFNCDMLLFSRRVLFAGKILEFRGNAILSKNYPNRLTNIPAMIDGFRKIMKDYDSTSNISVKILEEVKKVATEIRSKASTTSSGKKAEEEIARYSAETQNLVNEISELTQEVQSTSEKLAEEFSKEQDVYMIIDKDWKQLVLS